MVIKSKKQRLNYKIVSLSLDWLEDILPDNNKTVLEKLEMLPTEKYYTVVGQRRLNSYTYKWFKKRILSLLKKDKSKTIESITLKEVLDE